MLLSQVSGDNILNLQRHLSQLLCCLWPFWKQAQFCESADSPNDFNLHLSQLRQVLLRIKGANLMLKLSKCHFACSEVPYLGYVGTRKDLKMDKDKIKPILEISPPSTKKQLRTFLGMTGYYRNFIKVYTGVTFATT